MLNTFSPVFNLRVGMSLFEIWREGSPIFIDESKLSFEYVPKKLPHRKSQLKSLGHYFKAFVVNPGSATIKAVLLGPIGTGKTVVAKYFGQQVENFSKQHGFSIRYVHVNCHKDRTLFLIMHRVARRLEIQVPRRGFSSQELIYLIWNYLQTSEKYLLLAIDEADYLVISEDKDILYDLTRISEDVYKEQHRISLIFIFRDLANLAMIDSSIRSALAHNIVEFKPYTAKQIYDILWSRIVDERAIRPEAVQEETLELISELVGYDKGGPGDARLAIELLWRAGKLAERSQARSITSEHVQTAYNTVFPSLSKDILENLRKHELLFLYALTRTLLLKGSIKVPLGIVEKEYESVCLDLNENPRKHTMIWEYVRTLRSLGIISTEISKKGYRGKTTLLSIPRVPTKVLKEEIEKILEKMY